MASMVGCDVGSFPLNYLGMPIGGTMTRRNSWMPLVERFTKKLSTWKASCLSMGGRLTLCKSHLGGNDGREEDHMDFLVKDDEHNGQRQIGDREPSGCQYFPSEQMVVEISCRSCRYLERCYKESLWGEWRLGGDHPYLP